jgi:hypothetical protein
LKKKFKNQSHKFRLFADSQQQSVGDWQMMLENNHQACFDATLI